ncbi:flagellin [Trichlorobacter ammonificans]|uniref:Flagellin protein FlaA n=1 Tax=Trichlorobacter ammonificans TaxID=2916410 RepID=A0ABM9DBK1_9BACT|nr:flagellin [Trichlorobacter ammonificans]CAH2032603.1 Flagellin protein FlaA [Trichlorobacter ammonificans]
MAISDISLTSGMRSNLLSLQNTNTLINRTQDRLSTGKKVNSALDNPTNFFAAQGHNSRAADLSIRKDGMSEAVQAVKAADAGIKAITSLIEAAKGVASAALSTANLTERANYANTYNTLMSQINQLASDSGYRGTNFLTKDDLTVEFAPVTNDATLKIKGFNATSVGLSLQKVGITGSYGGVTSATAESSTAATKRSTSTAWDNSVVSNGTNAIKSSSLQLESALSTLRTESSKLSANLSVITTRQAFTDTMINTLTTGADNLTLADMNEEGANMLMLQTRQNLGITSLSMASQAAQAVLRLF